MLNREEGVPLAPEFVLMNGAGPRICANSGSRAQIDRNSNFSFFIRMESVTILNSS